MPAKFTLFKDEAGKFRFSFLATNGAVVATSAGYATKAAAKKGLASLCRNAADPTIEDTTTKPLKAPATARTAVRPAARTAATPVPAQRAGATVAKPAAKRAPAAKPVAKPAAKRGPKPAPRPAANPVSRPVAKPAAKPVTKPAIMEPVKPKPATRKPAVGKARRTAPAKPAMEQGQSATA